MKKKETRQIKEPPIGSIYAEFEEYLEKKRTMNYPPLEMERLSKIEKIRDHNDKVFNDAVNYGFYIWLVLMVAVVLQK